MFPKSKNNKSCTEPINNKSNINISLQSSKYHSNIFSKKKSTLKKKISFKPNNKFSQNYKWKKQNSYNNWNKENDKNYLNFEQYNSNHDNSQYYYNLKEKRDNKSYYNKEYSYLYSYEKNDNEKPRNYQKNEKKISIDYTTTQSNSSSHEELNNNKFSSNDKNDNITVINENYNSNDFKTLNIEKENKNQNNNNQTEYLNSLNFISNKYNNENNKENSNPNINIDNNNNQVNDPDKIAFPTCHASLVINPLSQKMKNKKQKKNQKFCLTSKEIDIKRNVSDNINNDFQSSNEPYNKFNSVNNEQIIPIMNPIVENTEILKVNVKISKDKNVVFKLRRFDDLFLTVKLFCEINSIEEKLMKPIITKALCTLNSIYQVYNTQLDSKNIKVLQMLKIFNSETAI